MTRDLAPLFRPLVTERITLRNRIVMAPMARNYAPDFIPDEKMAAYYARRAEGGVGLIITEASFIDHPVANGHKGTPAIFGQAAIAGYRAAVNRVHQAGGRIFCQIWHMGGERPERAIPNPEQIGVSPSGVSVSGSPPSKALELSEISEILRSYWRAARDVKAAGFDGVEIHGAHGYLIDSFLSAVTNRRTDAYGGTFEKRLRFAIEVIEHVRDAVGPDYPISFRTSQWTLKDYSMRIYDAPDELESALGAFSRAGVDIFHCSTRRFWEPEFAGSSLNLTGWARKVSGKPTISVGSVGLDGDFSRIDRSQKGLSGMASANPAANLDALVERMERDEFDMIAIGRALLANPDWVVKVQDNRLAELRPFTRDLLKVLH